jgi:uncharacterized protein YqeY
MKLEEKITDDLKAAIKARDGLRTSCLRMLKTAIKNRQVEKRDKLKDEEIQETVSSLIKKGKQAAEEFKKGGRDTLAAKEEAEITIYLEYLPQQATPTEIEKTLKDIIAESGAEGLGDLGRVMKQAMAQMAGKAQGKEVNEIARKLLG